MKRVSANTQTIGESAGFLQVQFFFSMIHQSASTRLCFGIPPHMIHTGYSYSGIPPCTGFSSRITASTLKMIQSPIQLSGTHTGYNYSGIPLCTGFSSRITASTLKMIQSPIQLSDTHTGYNYSGIPPCTGFSSRITASTLKMLN
jgi:hypothetical protein